MDLTKYESKIAALLIVLRGHDILSPNLPSGSAEACSIAEELGLAYARKDVHLSSSMKAIWIWRITASGCQWLKDRERPEVPPTD